MLQKQMKTFCKEEKSLDETVNVAVANEMGKGTTGFVIKENVGKTTSHLYPENVFLDNTEKNILL